MVDVYKRQVYGNVNGTVKENSPRLPQTASGQVLKELEDWLHNLPGTSVDILRLAGLVGPCLLYTSSRCWP